MAIPPFSNPPTPDATATLKGKIRLAGDLGGTATVPLTKRTSRFIVAPYGDTRPADYTCASATGNEVEINAAIIAANALTDGGIVDLLDGKFVVSDWILPLNNVWLCGQGMFQTKLVAVSGSSKEIISFPMTRDAPLSKFVMTDLELDDSQLNPAVTTKALHGLNYTDCRFQRLYIHDATATGFGADFPRRSLVSDCLVMNCGYTNKRMITAASWSGGVYTYTSVAHGYSAGATATGTLTASGIISDGDTVTIDGLVYTFRTSISLSFDIALGVNTATALSNLQKAINLSGIAGTDYGIGTIANPSVDATSLTTTTVGLTSTAQGAASNSITTTETGANLAFGASTLLGGVTASKIVINGMHPYRYNGNYLVSSVIDANNFTVDASNNSTVTSLSIDPGTATVFGQSSDSLIGHNGIGIGANDNYDESVIVTNNICISNQNNNFLIEDDSFHVWSEYNPAYIFSDNISIGAGNVGYRNTGSQNAQFNNNSDYNSRIGGLISPSTSATTLLSASWSGGIATFTTAPRSADYVAGVTPVIISGMIPSTWNGYYIVTTVPDSHTFTVAMVADPGIINYLGKTTALLKDVNGTTYIDNNFNYNHDYGIQTISQASRLMFKNNTIGHCLGYGIRTDASDSQIIGNQIFNCGLNGILLSSGSIKPFMNFDLLSNQIFNNGQQSGDYGIKLVTSSTTTIKNIKINNNRSYDNQTTKTQTYGLGITGTGIVTGIDVSSNDLTGNLTSPYVATPTAGIALFNNVGLNPQASSVLGNITGSVTFDSKLGSYFKATLTGNITPIMPASLIDGQIIIMVLTQDATGSRTWTAPSNTITMGTLTLSTAANSTDTITWSYSITLAKWVEVSRSIHDVQYPSIVSKTTNFTMTVANDIVLADSTSGSITIKLPSAVGIAGKKITVKRLNTASSFNIFFAVATSSGQTIDGVATQIILTDQWQSSTVVSDGANWYQTSTVDDPMTTLGDITYMNSSLAPARLAGNITSTKKYLSQTGTGVISAVPGWAQIGAADLSDGVTGSGAIVLATSPTLVTPVLGTPSSGVATNLTGTATGLTAGNVTTNANLTGPITSSGNATSIASQTGTGTKFVVDTSPSIATPTITGTLTVTSGNINQSGGFVIANTTTNLILQTSGANDIIIRPQAAEKFRIGASALTIADAVNIVVNTTTGTKIGTATTQKLSFYNATPIVQEANTIELGTVLSDLGLRAVGSAYPITTTGAVSTGSLTLGTAGNKLNITTGSNASAGTGTLSGGTVTISTTAVTANSLIFLTDTASVLTNVGTLSVSAKVAGTSFTVTSANVLDNSTFNWFLIN